MVRHADIVEVSKNTDVFVSGYGVMFDVLPPVFLQMAMSFLAMDNPQHDKVRGLVGKAFTRPQIRRIDDDIASRARRIVATAREKATAGEPIDFVSDISRHLPIEMFGDMFGVPEELRPTVAHARRRDRGVGRSGLAGRTRRRPGASRGDDADPPDRCAAHRGAAGGAGRRLVDQSGAGRGRW